MSGMVIIGGGLAGGRAARMLREEGYQGKISIIAGEPHYPYQRPPLSKGVMQGSEEIESVFLKPDSWYGEQHIDVLTGVVATRINPASHEVILANGSQLPYEKLLIATGSRARTLPIEGHDLEGVYTLRTLDDALALKSVLTVGGKNLVLIGSGWIGMEVAASARGLGNTVTILERESVPLSAVLGEELGNAFRAVHDSHGVIFHMNANVQKIVGSTHVEGVLVDGEIVPADLVLVGVGAIPNTELAEQAGLEVKNGILADASLATNEPDVFAAGDVANVMHPFLAERLRSEHWSNAINQGKAAALAMLGRPVSYDEIPYFYTDQFDLGVELSGYPNLMRDAKIIVRGSLADRKYIAFWVREGKVVAGMNVNIWDVNETVQKLIRSDKAVDETRLIDTSVDLESLVAA